MLEELVNSELENNAFCYIATKSDKVSDIGKMKLVKCTLHIDVTFTRDGNHTFQEVIRVTLTNKILKQFSLFLDSCKKIKAKKELA